MVGLKAPYKQPKRRRLWFNDGSCVRLRASHKNHVWSYDFVMTRTHDGRPVRILAVLDEYTRECLAIDVGRRMNHKTVLDTLCELFIHRGTPEYIRSDNGPEFVAQDLRDWLDKVDVNTAYIEPGSPWENGYIESFSSRSPSQKARKTENSITSSSNYPSSVLSSDTNARAIKKKSAF